MIAGCEREQSYVMIHLRWRMIILLKRITNRDEEIHRNVDARDEETHRNIGTRDEETHRTGAKILNYHRRLYLKTVCDVCNHRRFLLKTVCDEAS